MPQFGHRLRRTRRSCLRGVASAILAATLPSLRAQAPDKVWRIGYLNPRAGPSALDAAFLRGMAELGYVPGRNLVVEYRWADNQMHRLQPLAEELVRLEVDVIVTATLPAVRAAMRATSTIPIVMLAIGDPVGTRTVASLARPGGNVTGLTLQTTDLARKRLQLLRELIPSATRVAVLTLSDPDARLAAELLLAESEVAAQQLGMTLIARGVTDAGALAATFDQFQRERAQALFVQVNPLALQHAARYIELAARTRLPAMYEVRSFVDLGGLVSYGPNLTDMYHRGASYVDRIFKGARPGNLAIEQPRSFEMVVNLATARALGLAIPDAMRVRANDLIG